MLSAGEDARMSDRMIESLGEAECLRLISPGGIGRIAYQSRFGPAILPVTYKLHEGAIVFRTTCEPGSRTPSTRLRSRSTSSIRLPARGGAC